MDKEQQEQLLKKQERALIAYANVRNLINIKGDMVTGNIGPFYSDGGKDDYHVIVNRSGGIGVGRVLATIVNIVIIELVPGFFDDKKADLDRLIGPAAAEQLPPVFAEAKERTYYNAGRKPNAHWIVALPSDVILQSEIDFRYFPHSDPRSDPTHFHLAPSSTPVTKNESEIINYGYYKDEAIDFKSEILNLANMIMTELADQREHPSRGGARKRTTRVSRKQRKQRKQCKSRKQRK
jgi:hypothetical protein